MEMLSRAPWREASPFGGSVLGFAQNFYEPLHDIQRFLGLGPLFNDALGLLDDALVLALFLFFVLAIGIGSATTNTCAGSHVKSPAEVAGLKPNDKIVSVAGTPVGNWNQLHTALSAQKAGVPVPVVVDRGGRNVSAEVTTVL